MLHCMSSLDSKGPHFFQVSFDSLSFMGGDIVVSIGFCRKQKGERININRLAIYLSSPCGGLSPCWNLYRQRNLGEKGIWALNFSPATADLLVFTHFSVLYPNFKKRQSITVMIPHPQGSNHSHLVQSSKFWLVW